MPHRWVVFLAFHAIVLRSVNSGRYNKIKQFFIMFLFILFKCKKLLYLIAFFQSPCHWKSWLINSILENSILREAIGYYYWMASGMSSNHYCKYYSTLAFVGAYFNYCTFRLFEVMSRQRRAFEDVPFSNL